MGEEKKVIIAHDYQCPWCYLAFFQAKRLKSEFPDLQLEWQGYELLPAAQSKDLFARPKASERFQALIQTDNLPAPTSWPVVTNSHYALEGAEYVKDKYPDLFDQYNEKIYRALWEQGQDISNPEVLSAIAKETNLDADQFMEAVTKKQYANKIIPFKDTAFANGVTHVTTFRFLGEQCAEAPYATIKEMAERFIAWYK